MSPPHASPAGEPDDALAETLLDAAQRSFVEHGFQGTKMEHLAKRSGVSVGQLYQVFGNKEALFIAVLERAQTTMLDEYLDPAYDNPPATGGALAHLTTVFRAYLRFYFEHREVGPLILGVSYDDRHDAAIARVVERVNEQALLRLARLYAIIEGGIARGELRKVDAGDTVRWFWGSLYGVLALNLRFPAIGIDDAGLERVLELGMHTMELLLAPDA